MWTIVARDEQSYQEAIRILQRNLLEPFAQVMTDLTIYPVGVDIPADVQQQLRAAGCDVVPRQ